MPLSGQPVFKTGGFSRSPNLPKKPLPFGHLRIAGIDPGFDIGGPIADFPANFDIGNAVIAGPFPNGTRLNAEPMS